MEERAGLIVFRASGRGARELFADEAGGHRWQRVPPTERRGRVHSSTITIAVLAEPTELELPPIPERELAWSACRASGSGGQHLQKTDSAIQLRHVPTGLVVKAQETRSQHQNRAVALATLRARLLERARADGDRVRADARRAQVGSGMRGDKRRTIRVADDSVVDHATGRAWRYRDYVRGAW